MGPRSDSRGLGLRELSEPWRDANEAGVHLFNASPNRRGIPRGRSAIMGEVTGSIRSDPRWARAARRAVFPSVRAREVSPGRWHPASAQDVREALHAFGPEAYYGLRLVELRPARANDAALVLGRLAGEGVIELYEQRPSPWRLGDAMSDVERDRLAASGADVTAPGVVVWPPGTLRRFMLLYVLAHELGHHVVQHERRLRGQRAMRTREHEARAEEIAATLREQCRSI